MSTALKMWLPARRARLSWTVGMGKLSFFVTSFSLLQSTHHRMRPSFLRAATRLELHREFAGSMTPWSSHESSCFLRSASSAGLMGRYRHLIGGTSSVMILCFSRCVFP